MVNDLKELLYSIGYHTLVDDGRFWRTNAVYRNGDNKTSLRINKVTGQFADFVQKESGSIDELIQLTLGLDEVQLKKFYEGNLIDINTIVQQREKPVITMEKTWKDTELTNMLPHYAFYEERGISKETLQFFRSGFAHSGSMNQRYVFPIYNRDGLIHGWSGRDLTGKKDAKWKHIGRKAGWLYPAFMAEKRFSADGKNSEIVYPCLDEIVQSKEVILVESIGDMLKLWECGHKNVLVTFGLVPSTKLGSFLMTYQIDRLVIAFNNDFESEINRGRVAAVSAFIDLMHYIDLNKIVIALPRANDFGASTDEEIAEWAIRKTVGNDEGVYKEVLEELRRRYREGTITKTEAKFGKAISTYYDEIKGSKA